MLATTEINFLDDIIDDIIEELDDIDNLFGDIL